MPAHLGSKFGEDAMTFAEVKNSPTSVEANHQGPLVHLKALYRALDPGIYPCLASHSTLSTPFTDLLTLSTLRKKAIRDGIPTPWPAVKPIRIAAIGGGTLFPFLEIFEHFLFLSGQPCDLWAGDFDNYVSEIMDEEGELSRFKPELTIILPSSKRCEYSGGLGDSQGEQRSSAVRLVEELLGLCETLHQRTGTEIILANFLLPGRMDPGAFRSRSLGSPWAFRKLVNTELGLQAPAYIQICDVEFLGCRVGNLNAADDRGWFESKQLFTPDMTALVAHEAALLAAALKRSTKKVLVMDLDNTLWGGVVGDDGLDGIELGDTSPRGEAFKAFQKFALALSRRGILLAVCSKNDYEKATEPFEKHPEMVLRLGDIASFKANWNPKSDNLREIAADLNLGLDSFVFVDDNPAEIEIVRQFVPEVEAILLGPDPSRFLAILEDARCFEPRTITTEDTERALQYQHAASRRQALDSTTDMATYLRSLEMVARISPFNALDVPRITQLINKSNQFNLTTRRRTEAEVLAILGKAEMPAFSVRLSDRFGDNGLISVVIGQVQGGVLEIDTWLMSCRVLKRGVEELVTNEIFRIAKELGLSSVRGVYLPTPKNAMVRTLFPAMGFRSLSETPERQEFILDLVDYHNKDTEITVQRSSLDPK